MKRTLIFLTVFFLSFATFAEIQKKYHVDKKTGIVTLELIEVQVVERLSFTNTTSYSFSDQELEILFQGGEVTRTNSEMESIFPLITLETKKLISISEGQTTVYQDPATKSQKDWRILWWVVLLPLVNILFLGVATPKSKDLVLLLLFTIIIISTVWGCASLTIFDGFKEPIPITFMILGGLALAALAGWTAQSGGMIFVVLAFFLAILVCVSALSFYHKNALVLQYILFIVASCAVSFLVRKILRGLQE